MKIHTLTRFALLGALALTLSFLESLLIPAVPFLPVGVRLGLSNIATAFAAVSFGAPGAFAVTLLKAGFTFLVRGASAFWMSLGGGLLSTAVLCLSLRLVGKNVSMLGVSLLSAAAHNMGQLLAAVLLSGTVGLLSYGKWLLLFSLPAGALTGFLLHITLPRLQALKLHFEK